MTWPIVWCGTKTTMSFIPYPCRSCPILFFFVGHATTTTTLPTSSKQKRKQKCRPQNRNENFWKNRAVVAAAAAQWHALGREEQSKYYELARKERQVHMQLHPGWTARDNYAQGKKRKRRREKPSEAGGNWKKTKQTKTHQPTKNFNQISPPKTPFDFADRSTLPLFFYLVHLLFSYLFFFTLLYGILCQKIRKRKRKIKSTAAHKPSPYLSAHSFFYLLQPIIFVSLFSCVVALCSILCSLHFSEYYSCSFSYSLASLFCCSFSICEEIECAPSRKPVLLGFFRLALNSFFLLLS